MTNIIDEVQIIVERGTAYGQQCEAIAHALLAVGIDPACSDFEQLDHPLVYLYRTLSIAARTNGLIYLTPLQQQRLAEALECMKRVESAELAARALREATADRLRLIANRSMAYADELMDVELALKTLGCDFTYAYAQHPLMPLHRDLKSGQLSDKPRHLNEVECGFLWVAAQTLSRTTDPQ